MVISGRILELVLLPPPSPLLLRLLLSFLSPPPSPPSLTQPPSLPRSRSLVATSSPPHSPSPSPSLFCPHLRPPPPYLLFSALFSLTLSLLVTADEGQQTLAGDLLGDLLFIFFRRFIIYFFIWSGALELCLLLSHSLLAP